MALNQVLPGSMPYLFQGSHPKLICIPLFKFKLLPIRKVLHGKYLVG